MPYRPGCYFAPCYFGGASTPLPATFWAAVEAAAGDLGGALMAPLRQGRAPAGTRLPYAEYERAGADPLLWNTAAEATWDGSFTVAAYAATDAQADALVAATVAALEDADLAWAGPGTLVYLRPRRVDDADEDPDPGPEGEDVYAARVEFRYLIHR